MLCKAITANGKACRNLPVEDTAYCRIHHPVIATRPSNGKSFEEDVAKILTVLGYNVQLNKLINNCQIDIYAEHFKGVISHKIMVECKEYGGDKFVGMDEMRSFAGALSAARGQGIVHQGLFVTTNGYTAPAKGLAFSSGIELTTFADLSTQLVNFDSYVERIITDFEALPVGNCYVDLSGTETEAYDEAPDVEFFRPIDDYINRCLYQDGHAKLALLGNFGTGKSTFCQKYAYDLAKKYKDKKGRRIPVIINLKDYDSKIVIHELILNTLLNRFGVSITQSTFYELQRLGKFIFLFDGFDEMDARANPETISSNLRELNKILDIKENKFILTCRTHFFRNKIQVEVLDDFKMLYIPEWGEMELKEFLQKKFGEQWKEKLMQISGAHNLPELAQTPLFLEMIAETLPTLGEHVKRIELYKVYTDKWIKNQIKHKGAILSTEERRSFIKELAIKLYSEDRFSCHYSELIGILQMYLQRIKAEKGTRFIIEDAVQLDHLSHDVQTCTFLVRNTAGDYSFKHTSFLEFFVAQTLAEDVEKGVVTYLEKIIIPITIRGFLVDFLKETMPEDMILACLKNAQGEILKNNLVMLASLLKIDTGETEKTSGEKSQDEIISKFIKGDSDAFNKLYEQLYPSLYSYCYTLIKDTETAKEIVIDAFLRVWQKRELIENLSALELKKYLFVSVRNSGIDHLRRKAVNKHTLSDLQNETVHIDEAAMAENLQVELEALIKKLPAAQRSILKLSMQGLSNSEIAEMKGIQLATVKNMKANAMKTLRELLKNKL